MNNETNPKFNNLKQSLDEELPFIKMEEASVIGDETAKLMNEIRNGLQTNLYSDGRRFNGHYLSGLRHGMGQMTFSEGGRTFNGRYIHDLAEGYGSYEDPVEGTLFRGSFKGGLAEGQGACSDGAGGWIVGTYKEGYRQGWFTWRQINGDEYERDFGAKEK